MGRTQSLRTILFVVVLMPFTQVGLADSTGEESRPRNPFQAISEPVSKDSRHTPSDEPTFQPGLGLPGARISDIKLVGIISSDELSFAMLTVKNQFTFIAKAGSRLRDGKVLLVSESGVLFERSTNSQETSEVVFRPFGEETQ